MVESKYGDFLTLEPIPINNDDFDAIQSPPQKTYLDYFNPKIIQE
jgi:hypothetical protein